MKSLKETKTEENVLTAFAGESQARNRYTYFASKAKKEGYEQIHGIFLETADNEKEHAERLFKFLEHTAMYPEFANIADEEGFSEVAEAMRAIAVAEKQHEKRYLGLLDNLINDRAFKRDKVVKWICRNCGYIHEGSEPPDECPACAHPKAYYELLAENW